MAERRRLGGIVDMIAAYKRKSNIAAVVCALSIAGVVPISPDDPGHNNPFGTILVVSYCVSFLLALWWLLKAKGRSGGNLCWLFLSVIGFVVILRLEDRCKDGQPLTLETSSDMSP
jgi:protein-S-isoprenylcysteine O-methyltransferase Ste14